MKETTKKAIFNGVFIAGAVTTMIPWAAGAETIQKWVDGKRIDYSKMGELKRLAKSVAAYEGMLVTVLLAGTGAVCIAEAAMSQKKVLEKVIEE